MTTVQSLTADLEAIRHDIIECTLPVLDVAFTPWEPKKTAHFAEYLRNNFLIAEHVLVNVGLALEHSPRIDVHLRKELLEYGLEELGHDLWILKDLKALGVEHRPAGWRPHWAMTALIAHSEAATRKSPLAYLGHVYPIEALAASIKVHIKAGKTFGYPKNALTFLGSHADINDVHADTVIKNLVRFTTTDAEAEGVVIAAQSTAKLFARFLLDTFRY